MSVVSVVSLAHVVSVVPGEGVVFDISLGGEGRRPASSYPDRALFKTKIADFPTLFNF